MSEEKTHVVDAILHSLAEDTKAAKERFALIPRMPKVMPKECKALWSEVGFSFMFGQHYAALSVCAMFVECLLTRAIPEFELRHGRPQPKLPLELGGKINLGARIGLISKQDKAILHGFREQVRNRLAHGQLSSVADAFGKVQKVTMVYVKDEEIVEYRDLAGEDLSALAENTIHMRLDIALRKLAPRVIPWSGLWARECALRVWGNVSKS